ncbi:MAG: alpha-ketoglutarate-dependent dioxygenase AlkB [Cyclobacteriaceae bacterium]
MRQKQGNVDFGLAVIACGELISNGNMELFDNFIDPTKNLLPSEGVVHYYNKVLSAEKANHFFDQLLSTIEWRQDEAVIFGKHIFTKRKVAWYGDKPFDYTYSNTTKKALPWTSELKALKKLAEEKTNETYNSCLMNLYHSGEEGMAWHSDGEKDLKRNGAIASISLGAERRFGFKHKQTGEKVMMLLEHGSLMVMKGETQSHWLHRLPPTKKVNEARINLTFRTIESNI